MCVGDIDHRLLGYFGGEGGVVRLHLEFPGRANTKFPAVRILYAGEELGVRDNLGGPRAHAILYLPWSPTHDTRGELTTAP